MISVGDTFLSPTPGYSTEHLYITIGIKDVKALFVNVTTKKEKADCSCLLNKGEHAFLTHESVINYADAKVCDTSLIEKALQSKLFKVHKPVSPKLLDKILNGAKVSPSFPPKYLEYIK